MAEDTSEPALLDLHQAAELLGAYCAIERRLFELTGSLATEPETVPEIGVYLDSLSTEHAWHAELWADRLPVVSGIDAHGPGRGAAGGPRGASDELSSGGSGRTDGRPFPGGPAQARRLLRLSRGVASAASEAPTRRALRLVLRDEIEALVAGEALVQGLLGYGRGRGGGRAKRSFASSPGWSRRGWVPGLVPWPGRRA